MRKFFSIQIIVAFSLYFIQSVANGQIMLCTDADLEVWTNRITNITPTSSGVSTIDPSHPSKLGEPWTDRRQNYYMQLGCVSNSTLRHTGGEILAPLTLSITPIFTAVCDTVPSSVVSEIKVICLKRKNRQDQIACAAKLSATYIQNNFVWRANGLEQGGYVRSYCRTHANLFSDVIASMYGQTQTGPRSFGAVYVDYFTGGMDYHVLNSINYYGNDGKYYEYAIDIGHDKGTTYFYPINSNALALGAIALNEADCASPTAVQCGGTILSPTGVCKDIMVDNNNCGKCGNVCLSSQTCNAGVCVSTLPPPTTPLMCGYLAMTCCAGRTCYSGRTCTPDNLCF